METLKETIKIAIDSGNSETAFIESGELIRQPSTVVEEYDIPFYEDLNLPDAVENIYKHLVVSIDSPALERFSTYFIGEYAIESQGYYSNTELGQTAKHTSEVPVQMALGLVAARVLQKAYKEGMDVTQKEINATINLTTGLPVREYNSESAAHFANRFMKGFHYVTIHLGKEQKVRVKLDFEFVKVFPEAVPVVFSLVFNPDNKARKGSIFKEFQEKYGYNPFDGKHFAGKRILHIDIGDGTTEFPITEGFNPDHRNAKGENYGIGHAVENILEDYAKLVKIDSAQRQDVSRVLKDKTHKFHGRAMNLVKLQLRKQADQIMRYALRQLNTVQNNIDVIVVYGGGSILLKPYLYNILEEKCEEREIELFYVPEENASTLFVEGLNNTFYNGLFNKLKESAEQKASLTK